MKKMFGNEDVDKVRFLEQTKSAREERAHEKLRNRAAVKIQAIVRGFNDRQRTKRKIRADLDKLLGFPKQDNVDYTPTLKPALTVYLAIQRFLFIMDDAKDRRRFGYLCRYLLVSMNAQQNKECYVCIALLRDHVLTWIHQVKRVLWKCCTYLEKLQPESHSDMKVITVYLHMLVTFTSTASWKVLKGKNGDTLAAGMNQLCNNIMGHLTSHGLYSVLQTLLNNGLARTKPIFTHATLTAIVTIALRPLISSNFSDTLFCSFLLHILSVPAVVHHIVDISPEMMNMLIVQRVFKRSLELLNSEQNTRLVRTSLKGNYSLCLLANLIQMGEAEMEGLVDNSLTFMTIMIRMLESCREYVLVNRSNLSHWHPVLGWFSQKTEQSILESMPYVTRQLQLLWSQRMIRMLFCELLHYIDTNKQVAEQAHTSKNVLKRAIEKTSGKSPIPKLKLDSNLSQTTCLPCAMYQTCLNTMTQLRLDILAGLSYQSLLLPSLWTFLKDLGPQCGIKKFLELLYQTPNSTIHPVFSLLSLFCDCATHLITILDENEFYSSMTPFTLPDYVLMSDFLNNLLFKLIWNNLIDVRMATTNSFFASIHMLLMVLYERDSRRSFTSPGHWLIKDVKSRDFMAALEKGKKTAQFLMSSVPHVIPFKDRVVLFRSCIDKEKEALGLTETLHVSPHTVTVTIHRIRTVEDGYRQLVTLPATSLKGIIRVKFINEQGLDEAGIDQDGVFKEFLEETIAKVFDPSLNLFKVTIDNKLYPSPTSHIHDNHLGLFEFVGKMLGKAIYEGIVVEVPFASFFLTQILGHQYTTHYSFLDDLPSLDAELYKNLTYVKNYDGDVSDLDLTFSCDEEFLGRLVTYELVPGGRAIAVTNENKLMYITRHYFGRDDRQDNLMRCVTQINWIIINAGHLNLGISYVHQMAMFRLYGQIKEQAAAFIRGLKTVVNPDWLMMFSTQELQKLISGDADAVDISDLRQHTQYYGGYHNRHKVIAWLWAILEGDFTHDEQCLFLKFVTSCSKPPLLGFAHLEPPFSIRCVEISDDQDTGDTVGSVLKGFFNIRKRDQASRLPTSSTCFNLLKLPNYSKKAVLKDKLRYAIHSNTGFELS